MTEITLTGAAGVENGTELAQVLTQYASDYFDSFTYNTETEEVECKSNGDDTVWVKIKIASDVKFSTTLFNGWSTSPPDSSFRQINTVYVFNNCVIIGYKKIQARYLLQLAFFARTILEKYAFFY
jgi:hypothetical protein